MVRVLIVDDSPTARVALSLALESDPEITVVAQAANGAQALNLVVRHAPDIVTMDVHLRRERGLDVAAQIMADSPCPILVVTGVNPTDPDLAYRALEVGALDVVGKLPAPTHSTYEQSRARLVRLVKTFASVPVVHRARPKREAGTAATSRARRVSPSKAVAPRVIAIGASTGGPPAIAELLRQIPSPCPVPILIVQHISEGFSEGFAEWLGKVTGHRAQVVKSRCLLEPGRVFVADDGQNLCLTSPGQIAPTALGPAGPHCPSIDVLFTSIADCIGAQAIGIILTGMGRDGRQGMTDLHGAGAVTIAQEPSSCVVDSMPKAAISADVVCQVFTIDRIAKDVGQRLTHRRQGT